MSPAPVRFHDPGTGGYGYRDSVLVRCPGCDRVAHFESARVICRSCGRCGPVAQGTWPALWLRAETRHGELWAYSLEHLDLIRRFVAADLRERAPWYEHGRKMTVVARLPAWVKSAKNRTEVLRVIDRMRRSVIEG
ncbi:hypothetical protein [Streptomyces sp. NPDC002779]|jgi:hypothetical protein|uniref:hypothetical protein n=1 Tax=Streptomyces sp. NPDC002779 TaxID=3364664 RepID=UPI00367EC18A